MKDPMNKNTVDGDAAPIVIWHEGMEPIGPVVCAMGVFDGVHEGHQYLIKHTLVDSCEHGVSAWIVTFDRDPEEVLNPGKPCHKLLSNEDRLQMLACTGVDGVMVLPFNNDLSVLDPEAFCDTFLSPIAAVRSIHVGVGFRYGAMARGTTDTLDTWMRAQGGTLTAHELYDEGGSPVSATRIRGLLTNSEVEQATRLLTRPFYLRGSVVEGRGMGRRLGIPTANLKPEYPAVTLGDGVYGGYALVADRRYQAAISIGAASTFGIEESTIEPHLLDFDGDIYGQEVVISFHAYLRPMTTYDSPEELKKAINANISWIRENLPL